MTVDETVTPWGDIEFTGRILWTEAAGAAGEPAPLPVVLYRVDQAAKTLVKAIEQETRADGTFHLVVPGGEYVVAVRPERATNMPERARRLMAERKGKNQ